MRTCFLQLFNRIVIKKTAVLNQFFLILERFALFLLLNSLNIIIKNNLATIEIDK